jgi:type VI secretion system protein ImpC
MIQNTQKKLGQVRPPRVQITYDVDIGQAQEKKELPFVIGVIADAYGVTETKPLYAERHFVYLDQDNFCKIMKSMAPKLILKISIPSETSASTETVPKISTTQETIPPVSADVNHLETKSASPPISSSVLSTNAASPSATNASLESASVELVFSRLEDFHPDYLLQSVPYLKDLIQKRYGLVDLSIYVDANPLWNKGLKALGSQKDVLTTACQKGDDPSVIKIFQTSKALENDGVIPDSIKIGIQEFSKNLLMLPEQKVIDVYGVIMISIEKLDVQLSQYMDQLLHSKDFQRLEAVWRGLFSLVSHAETGEYLKIRFLSASVEEISEDLLESSDFDQSFLFKQLYEKEYGTFGGAPYSCLIWDHYIGRTSQNMDLLTKMAGICAAAHIPCFTGADAALFGLTHFSYLDQVRDVSKIFESTEMIPWNSLREQDDARYIGMILPRVLVRAPYGIKNTPIKSFLYEESVDGDGYKDFCWGHAGYLWGQRITEAFSRYGWTSSVIGVEGGGLVENLPFFTFETPRGDIQLKSASEIILTDRKEKELSDLGFMALCQKKGNNKAVFLSGQSIQKAKQYDQFEATANARVSARITYLMNVSRFAHYIKVIMREKIGSFKSSSSVQHYLQKWLNQYILLNSDNAPQELLATYPLHEGKVTVVDLEDNPGFYDAILYLKPHFQMEGLTASLRLVSRIPV